MYRPSARELVAFLGLLAFTCDDAASPPDEIAAACQRVAEYSGEVGVSERDCRDELNAEYDEASGYGCGSAYANWVSCLATSLGECQPPGNSSTAAEPDVDPCQDVYDLFRDCQGRMRRDECVVIGNLDAGSCSISCALFWAECAVAVGETRSSSCSCTQGEKLGATFTGVCGTEELEPLARNACQ